MVRDAFETLSLESFLYQCARTKSAWSIGYTLKSTLPHCPQYNHPPHAMISELHILRLSISPTHSFPDHESKMIWGAVSRET